MIRRGEYARGILTRHTLAYSLSMRRFYGIAPVIPIEEIKMFVDNPTTQILSNLRASATEIENEVGVFTSSYVVQNQDGEIITVPQRMITIRNDQREYFNKVAERFKRDMQRWAMINHRFNKPILI